MTVSKEAGDALVLDEAAARAVVLVRALESAEDRSLQSGRWLEPPELAAVDREALQICGEAQPLDGQRYLVERSRLYLARMESRAGTPGWLLGLRERSGWPGALAIGLPLAALVLGVLGDRALNPGHVNMLSPPLLGVVAWNVAMYALLIASLFWHPKWAKGEFTRPLYDGAARLRDLVRGRVRSRAMHAEAASRFHALWFEASSKLQSQRARQVLHLSAAMWGLGLGLSFLFGAAVQRYEVGWSSTIFDAPVVYGFLRVLFAPVTLLLPVSGFTQGDVERMMFGAGHSSDVADARHWVWLYLALLTLVVVVPRLALAAFARWRARKEAGRIRIDLKEPYFAQRLARANDALRAVRREAAMRELASFLAASRRVLASVPEKGLLDGLLNRTREREARLLAAWDEIVALQRETLARLLKLEGADATRADELLRGLQGAAKMKEASSAMEHGIVAAAGGGAAVGATLDVFTGGLTLGAGAALGALLSGGAAFLGTVFRNRGVLEELWLALVEVALLIDLLALSQSGASAQPEPPDEATLAAWRSEVVAQTSLRGKALAALVHQPIADEQTPSRATLVQLLGDMALAVQRRLRETPPHSSSRP